jgi:hypothetical protein
MSKNNFYNLSPSDTVKALGSDIKKGLSDIQVTNARK